MKIPTLREGSALLCTYLKIKGRLYYPCLSVCGIQIKCGFGKNCQYILSELCGIQIKCGFEKKSCRNLGSSMLTLERASMYPYLSIRGILHDHGFEMSLIYPCLSV